VIAESYQTKFQISLPDQQVGPLSLSLAIAPGVIAYCASMQQFTSPCEMAVMQYPQITTESSQADALDFFLMNQSLVKRKFEKVNVSVLNSNFTLIPKAFSNNNSTSALDFTSGTASKKHLHHHLPDFDIVASIEEDLAALIERSLPLATVRHTAAVSLSLFFSQHSLLATNLFLQVTGSQMELMAKKDGKLIFYNVFNASSQEDVLYYLLFAMEQFGIDPKATHLTFAGDRTTNDPLLQMITKYVKQLQFAAHDASLKLQGDFIKLPSHLYFHLLNQHLCE
jgi:hypothetical protein